MISRLLFWFRGRGRGHGRGRSIFMAAVLLACSVTAIGLFTGTVQGGAGPAPVKEAKNPFEGKPEAIKAGEKIFDAKCSECHMDGTGGAGPDLTDDKWIYGGSDAEVFETVSGGRKGGMPSWKSELSKDDIWQVIAYIRSLHRK